MSSDARVPCSSFASAAPFPLSPPLEPVLAVDVDVDWFAATFAGTGAAALLVEAPAPPMDGAAECPREEPGALGGCVEPETDAPESRTTMWIVAVISPDRTPCASSPSEVNFSAVPPLLGLIPSLNESTSFIFAPSSKILPANIRLCSSGRGLPGYTHAIRRFTSATLSPELTRRKKSLHETLPDLIFTTKDVASDSR